MSRQEIDPKVIESIPPAVLRTMPAGQPPPGIQPNFADPPSLVPAVLGTGVAFLALATVCFSIRIYTKALITKKWTWDDRKIQPSIADGLGWKFFVLELTAFK